MSHHSLHHAPRRMWSRLLTALGCVALIATAASAEPRQPRDPVNGVARDTLGYNAIINATLIPEPGRTMEDATIVIKGGVIQSVSSGGEAPAGARVWDAEGLLVHSAFIEPFLEVEAPDENDASAGLGKHWNPKVMAERSALEAGTVSDSDASRLRNMGFAVAHIAPDGGVFRGSSAVVTLIPDDEATAPESRILREAVGHVVALESGGFRSRGYPGSKMGVIALIRQTLSDTEWYAKTAEAHKKNPRTTPRPAPQNAIAALGEDLPLIFPVGDELDLLRADAIAKEFDRDTIIVGSGNEYRRLDAVVETGRTLIIPLAFTKAPSVSTEGQRAGVSLRTLMMWEQSPTNARRLVDAGADIMLTTSNLPKGQKFMGNLRSAIEHGLDEDDAFAMLTTKPAKLLGLEKTIGKVARGYAANLVVADAESPFDEEGEIRDLWIDGVRHEINAVPDTSNDGVYHLEPVGDDPEMFGSKAMPATLTVGKKGKTVSVEFAHQMGIQEGNEPKKTRVKMRKLSGFENRVGGALSGNEINIDGSLLLDFVIEGGDIIGTFTSPDGESYAFTGVRAEQDGADDDEEDAENKDDEDKSDEEGSEDDAPEVPETYGVPFGAFAYDEMPEQAHVVFRNATVWTSSDRGIIEKGEVEIKDGEILYVGKARGGTPGGARVLDLKGKHVTPGLIDCHSHTGISGGVNEGTLSSTAMVRIFDVINPDAIGWYRELAGGITAANQLHGSANAIGGQNSVVKLRWGCAHPVDMRIKGAPAGIKFALGENVKQSNWGPENTTRYPQTRMGVETFIRSRFIAASEYLAEQQRNEPTFRRDLELEALGEIINGERLIHCHSYRQDEILMLCRVAQSFGFKIGTFQHVLEGYKVAEVIKEAAIGGSSFSDWWAYKYEVVDAIPENGAIMHDVGVVVSFNSDSDELARRMNTEAGKAVKYGGVDPAEALKFVTLNPAIQLGIDDQTGSLERGKAADVAVWSTDPLSSMARCEMTFVDGRELFSLAKDRELRERASAEKRRLIQKLLEDPKAREAADADEDAEGDAEDDNELIDGAPPEWLVNALRAGGSASYPHNHEAHTVNPKSLELEYLWLLDNGMNPDTNRPGECGCGRWAGFREER